MKMAAKILFGVLFSFAFSFICIGYAALSTNMSVTGTGTLSPPEGIYITSVSSGTPTRLNLNSAEQIPYTTNLSSDVGKTNSRQAGNITYTITVKNNTPYIYAYSGIEYSSNIGGDYNGNSSLGSASNYRISVSVSGISTSTLLYPGDEITFTSTYTYGRYMSATDYKTLVNYKFGVNIDSVGDVAIDAVLKQFGVILNDTSDGGAYETLADKIDDKFDGNPNNGWKTNYIGNVADSSSADSQTVNMLFQGKLHITVDGEEVDVTVMIKREDVDGNLQTGDSYTSVHPNGGRFSASGCEYTLYITTDELNRSMSSAPVYAAVFTCNVLDDGSYSNWYMVGDMYEGTAQVVGYEGGESTGSFNTETWKATTKTYTVTDDYSYRVASGSTIQTATQATDSNATTVFRALLNDAATILNDNEYAGLAMVQLREAFEGAADLYTVSDNGTVTVNSGVTRSRLVPHIKALENALIPFAGVL